MGCASRKSDQSVPVIVKKETIHERHSMNPHQEDMEAEVLEEGKSKVAKDNPEMDVASKMNKVESKVTLADTGPLSQTLPISNQVNSSIVENPVLNFTLNNANNKTSEKPNFPTYEHKFDFDLEDEKRDEQDKENHKVVDDVFKELNDI